MQLRRQGSARKTGERRYLIHFFTIYILFNTQLKKFIKKVPQLDVRITLLKALSSDQKEHYRLFGCLMRWAPTLTGAAGSASGSNCGMNEYEGNTVLWKQESAG